MNSYFLKIKQWKCGLNIAIIIIIIGIAYVSSESCRINISNWSETETLTNFNEFMQEDHHIYDRCVHTRQTYCRIENLFIPNYHCSQIFFCNITKCLVVPQRAMQFAFTENQECIRKDQSIFANPFTFLSFSFHDENYTTNNFELKLNVSGKLYLYQNEATKNSALISSLSNKNNMFFCREPPTYVFEGIGALPNACSIVGLCNETSCTRLSYVTLSQSYYVSKSIIFPDQSFEFNKCTFLKYPLRNRRYALRDKSKPDPSIPIQNVESYGILNFNLPGMKYCGPGTNIEKMDDSGGPVNELDNLCRTHDIDYLNKVPAIEADTKLLEGLRKLGHPLLPLFASIFEAKNIFELLTGTKYTSSLYFVPNDFQPSLIYYVADHSAYDENTFINEAYAKKGKTIEQAWKTQLNTIWMGFCTAQTVIKPSELNSLNSTFSVGSCSSDTFPFVKTPNDPETPSTSSHSSSHSDSTSQQIDTNRIRAEVSAEINQEDEDEEHILVSTLYPNAPEYDLPCRILISEFCTIYKEGPSFIELKKVCPATHRNRKEMLYGYHLLILRAGDPTTIYMSVELHGLKMTKQGEKGAGKRPKNSFYFVVGTADSNPNMNMQFIPSMVLPASGIKSVPFEDGETFAIVLLNIPKTQKGDKKRDQLYLNTDGEGNRIETEMNELHKIIIQNFIQDMVLYGSPCSIDKCGDVLELLPVKPTLMPTEGFFSPIPRIEDDEQPREPPYLSWNHCSNTIFPFQLDDFAKGVASPNSKNNCPTSSTKLPFSMQGITLQSSAQKLVVNLVQFFQSYVSNPVIIEGTPSSITSSAIGINRNTVNRILENYKLSSMETPGKKRIKPKTVQQKFDSFHSDLLRRIIKKFYQENIPPYFKQIFDEFMKAANEQYEDDDPNRVEPFKCGPSTFRKILHNLGFKYGRINQRDAILMRTDISILREKYLNIMLENDNLETPVKVVWIDETWIDTNAKSGKGWVPKNIENYRERAAYTYKRNKIGRGPRVIILNAGGNDGFVPNVMEVFAVQKTNVRSDYHENITGPVFLKWFKKLLEELSKIGKHIIVMDNAPYHGQAEVPKSSDRKHVMYEWLQKNLDPQDLQNFPEEKKILRTTLWDMVKKLKTSKNFYTLDKLAEEAGHRVVRLPPYNCDLSPIELVWSCVKREIRNQNKLQTIDSIIQIAKDIMLTYPTDKWRAHVQHIKKLERQYREFDGLNDNFIERNHQLIIPIRDDDDDNDEDEDEDYNVIPTDPSIAISLVHNDEYIVN